MEDTLKSAILDRQAYPLWGLFNVERLKKTGSFQQSLPAYRETNGGLYAPIFTDKDLAARFAEERCALGLPNNELMPLESMGRVVFVLELYRSAGVSHVAVDMSTRRTGDELRYGTIRTITKLIQELQQ